MPIGVIVPLFITNY